MRLAYQICAHFNELASYFPLESVSILFARVNRTFIKIDVFNWLYQLLSLTM